MIIYILWENGNISEGMKKTIFKGCIYLYMNNMLMLNILVFNSHEGNCLIQKLFLNQKMKRKK